MSAAASLQSRVLAYWFHGLLGKVPPVSAPLCFRMEWFQGPKEMDGIIRKHFKDDLDAVVEKDLYVDELKQTPRGALSLIVLLDQFSRHIYRKSPKAFAGDSKAQAVAQWSLDKKFDQKLEPIERTFVYMPLMHSEKLDLQDICVSKFQELRDSCPEEREVYDKGVKSAVDHRTVIAKFGRYPHRNAVLGRTNTAEEEKYLAEGGSFPWEQIA